MKIGNLIDTGFSHYSILESKPLVNIPTLNKDRVSYYITGKTQFHILLVLFNEPSNFTYNIYNALRKDLK